MRRVVVTGMGVVSSLGSSLQKSWERLHTLENAVKHSDQLAACRGMHSHLYAPVTDFVMPESYTRKVIRTMGPVSIFALNATEQALEQAGLIDSPEVKDGRLGVAYGSCSGSVKPNADFLKMLSDNDIGSVTSFSYVKIMPHTTAANISIHFKTTGRVVPSNTACTSGSLAIGSAYELIKFGIQDIMIAGGAEEFSPTQVAVFDTLYATTIKNDTPQLTPTPYDLNRDGLVIGEGAGTLILEEYEHAKARGAHIFAEVVGFCNNSDGTHITQPNSRTMSICMNQALKDANLSPKDIGYVNGHGTATMFGDAAEMKATYDVFADKVSISTLKSYTGHTLGACGALESIWSIMMMNDNWYAPTLNLQNPDNKNGSLNHIMKEPKKMQNEFIMSNNFAFGGINTSIIFKRIA